MLRIILFISTLVSVIKKCDCEINRFVEEDTNKTSYSAFLSIVCNYDDDDPVDTYGCGSSILNQLILLTAAHCFEGCNPKTSSIEVTAGSKSMDHYFTTVSKYKCHEDYDMVLNENDVCLVMLRKPLQLSNTIKRVVIMKSPPVQRVGSVAGWGLVDEEQGVSSLFLKQATQKILPRTKCIGILGRLPKNSFCANTTSVYAPESNSGSALVIKNYIQMGIVSYKNADVMVYTDVPRHYEWILNTTKLLCEHKYDLSN